MSDELPVTQTKILREGFVACYEHRIWGTGYLDSSGGGNSFVQKLPDNKIRDDIEKANNDAKSIKSMTNYYGKEQVSFDTVKVVYYMERATHTDVTNETVLKNFIAERALKKLSEAEVEALQEYYRSAAISEDDGRHGMQTR